MILRVETDIRAEDWVTTQQGYIGIKGYEQRK